MSVNYETFLFMYTSEDDSKIGLLYFTKLFPLASQLKFLKNGTVNIAIKFEKPGNQITKSESFGMNFSPE